VERIWKIVYTIQMNPASSKLDRGHWRAQIVEPVLESTRRIVDAHHHVWPEWPVPGTHPAQALLADMTEAGHEVVASVFVEGFARWRTDGPEHLRRIRKRQPGDDGRHRHVGAPVSRCRWRGIVRGVPSRWPTCRDRIFTQQLTLSGPAVAFSKATFRSIEC
jgi:hypothetical protein